MENTIFKAFEESLSACRNYENKKMHKLLLKEIGVLEGLVKSLDLPANWPLYTCYAEEYEHFSQIGFEHIKDELEQITKERLERLAALKFKVDSSELPPEIRIITDITADGVVSYDKIEVLPQADKSKG